MTILLAVVGALGAGAIWWFRIKQIHKAGSDVVDAAQRARGALRRRQFRKKVEASDITAIEDPRVAAVVLMVGIASAAAPLSEAQEREIRAAMQDVMHNEDPEADLVFAKWLTSGVADLNSLVRRLAKLLTDKLDLEERRQFAERVGAIAALEGPPDQVQADALRRLRERLHLA